MYVRSLPPDVLGMGQNGRQSLDCIYRPEERNLIQRWIVGNRSRNFVVGFTPLLTLTTYITGQFIIIRVK